MLIKYDAADLDDFGVFANEGMDASPPCLVVFAKVSVSALLLFVPSLIVFANGSDLAAFAKLFAALPNAVGDDVGVVVGTFALVGVGVIGARVGSFVGSGAGERVGLFVGEEVGGS